MPSHNLFTAGDLVLFPSYPAFGVGLILRMKDYNGIVFADTLWPDGLMIQINVQMLQKSKPN